MASPTATGNAGVFEESWVAATILTQQLAAGSCEGLPDSAIVVQLGLQQRVVGGAHFDDITVDAEEPTTGPFSVHMQVKRTLDPVSSDPYFTDVIAAALATMQDFASDLEAGRLRLVVAVGETSPKIQDFRELLRYAEDDQQPDSLRDLLLGKAVRSGIVERYHQVLRVIWRARHESDPPPRDQLLSDRKSTDAAGRLLRVLWLWVVDAQPNGRDRLVAIDRLRGLLPDPDRAADAFEALAAIAQHRGPRAVRFSTPALRVALTRRGVALTTDPRRRKAWTAWQQATDTAVSRQPVHVAGVHLERPALRAALVDTLESSSQQDTEEGSDTTRISGTIVMTGPGGTGKSGLACGVLADLRSGGDPVVICSVRARHGDDLRAVERSVGASLADALAAAPTGGRPILLIDGAEGLLTDAGALLDDLLDAVDHSEGPAFSLVITTRDEAADEIVRRLTGRGRGPVTLRCPDLDQDEVEQLVRAAPWLRSLASSPRSRQLVRRLYIVYLLTTISPSLHPTRGELAGEEDVVELVHEQLIRRADGARPGVGEPDDREAVVFELAEAALADQLPTRPRRSAVAAGGLRSDDVLDRVPGGRGDLFAHDVLTDYAVALRLGDRDGVGLLLAAPTPRRLLRSVRIWMQLHLRHTMNPAADARSVVAHLHDVAGRLSGVDGERWLSLPWEAILRSGRADDLLAGLLPGLLDNDAEQLEALIGTAERRARTGAGSLPEPDTIMTRPLTDLLGRLGTAVPARLRPRALALARRTLQVADTMQPEALLSATRAWTNGWTTSPSETRSDQRSSWADALGVAGLLAAHWSATDAASFVSDHDPARLAVLVEAPYAVGALATHQPELLATLAHRYYLGTELDEQDTSPLGVTGATRRPVRDHDVQVTGAPIATAMVTGHPDLGPFAELLDADEHLGLNLIGALAEAASHASGARGAVFAVVVEGPSGPRVHRGPAASYLWFRGGAGGSGAPKSAVQALRRWADAQITEGRALHEVFERVLGAGQSLAVVAVAVSVAVAHIGQVDDELDQFLSQPLLWRLELHRRVNEMTDRPRSEPSSEIRDYDMRNVAMHLITYGSATRRARLQRLGEQLIERAPTLIDSNIAFDEPGPGSDEGALLAREYARYLDVREYQAAPTDQDGVVAVSVSAGGASEQSLDDHAAQLELSVAVLMLAHRARELRDAAADHDAPVPELIALHHRSEQLQAALNGREPEGPITLATAIAAVSAATLQVAAGSPAQLAAISEALSDTAVARAAALLRQQADDIAEWPGGLRDTEMLHQEGADRSAAVGLTALLADSVLQDATAVSLPDLEQALRHVALSASIEVREHLSRGLTTAATTGGSGPGDTDDRQRIALDVIEALIASTGLGPWHQGYRPRTLLPTPLADALRASTDAVLQIGMAAPAVAALTHIARSGAHQHAARARELLDALCDYDQRLWLSDYAYHFDRTSMHWRDALDRDTARRALDGELSQLWPYLDAFSSDPHELTGILQQLRQAADTPARLGHMFAIWPTLAERLRPTARLAARGTHGRRWDSGALDGALLPIPVDAAIDIQAPPLLPLVDLLSGWGRDHVNRPQDAYIIIDFLAAMGRDWIVLPPTIALVLDVLGANPVGISQSGKVVAWLRYLLKDDPPDAAPTVRLRALLDAMVRIGYESAISLSSELET